MAIVCACLTTLRPLFVGVNLSFLHSISWKGSHSASSSSSAVKSKRRWSNLRSDGESDQKKEEQLMSSLYERHKNDMEMLGFERVDGAGKQGPEALAENEVREDNIRENDTFAPLRVNIGDSMV